MSAPQELPISHTLPVDTNRGFFVKELFFSPLRFCGRQWMWITSDSNNQISQVAFKALAVPFFTCATCLSGSIAIIGSLFFSECKSQSVTLYNSGGNLDLLRKNVSNEQVAETIKTRLNNAGCECSVKVNALDREVMNNYYPDHIMRHVTLTNPSSTKITRFWEGIKKVFHNTDSPSLDSLYPCIYRDNVEELLPDLKRVLALYESITFSMAFDLAYVRIELIQG